MIACTDGKICDDGHLHQHIDCPSVWKLPKRRNTEGGNGSTYKEDNNSCGSFCIH